MSLGHPGNDPLPPPQSDEGTWVDKQPTKVLQVPRIREASYHVGAHLGQDSARNLGGVLGEQAHHAPPFAAFRGNPCQPRTLHGLGLIDHQEEGGNPLVYAAVPQGFYAGGKEVLSLLPRQPSCVEDGDLTRSDPCPQACFDFLLRVLVVGSREEGLDREGGR